MFLHTAHFLYYSHGERALYDVTVDVISGNHGCVCRRNDGLYRDQRQVRDAALPVAVLGYTGHLRAGRATHHATCHHCDFS